jgi:hypothetical protein
MDGIINKKILKPDQVIKFYNVNTYNKLLTFSICFNNNNKYYNEKLNALVDLIKGSNIIIAHISNITLEHFTYLDNKLCYLYDNVQVFKTENLHGTGSVIFLNKKHLTFNKTADNPYYFDLENSSTERKIIGCEVIYEETKINVLGIHLESGQENNSCRLEQLAILSGIIKEMDLHNYVIFGTFTFEQNNDENYDISNLGTNVWVELGCSMLTRGDNVEKIVYNSEHLHPNMYSIVHKLPNVPEPCGCYTGILCSFDIK